MFIFKFIALRFAFCILDFASLFSFSTCAKRGAILENPSFQIDENSMP
jgi:hypothetical protein